jgi:hypothetical protein
MRSNAASYTAETAHSLYGSAFSASEQAKAKDFLINNDDSSADVMRKLKGRMKLEEDHIKGKPMAAQMAAAARSAGGGASVVPGAAPGGSALDAALSKYPDPNKR